MYRQLAIKKYDLIVLDIMMPGDDGFTLCQKLRTSSSVPIIMLTAKGEDTDRIVGLEIGADDYLSKPFNPRELLARIKAIFRRVGFDERNDEFEDTKPNLFKFSEWTLNTYTRQLFSADKVEIALSSGEFNLLLAFLERPQRVLNRDQLLDVTKNRSAGPYDRSIDIQISRLRQKLEEDPKKPLLFKTIRGGGYMLTATVERQHASEKVDS